MPKTDNPTIAKQLADLETLLAWFESDEVTVEVAIKKYEEALILAKGLESQLKTAKNKVEVLDKKFGSE